MITHILPKGLDPATVGLIVVPVEKWPPRIRLLRRVQSEIPFGPYLVAEPGIYQPESNPHGALALRMGRKLLGIKPSEFEWICPLGAVGEEVGLVGSADAAAWEAWAGDYDSFCEHGEQSIMDRYRVTSVGCKLVDEIGWEQVLSATGGRGNLPDFMYRWGIDHPDHPWDSSFAWFVGVEVME